MPPPIARGSFARPSANTVSATLKLPCVAQSNPVASPVRSSSCTAGDLQIGQRRGLGNALQPLATLHLVERVSKPRLSTSHVLGEEFHTKFARGYSSERGERFWPPGVGLGIAQKKCATGTIKQTRRALHQTNN